MCTFPRPLRFSCLDHSRLGNAIAHDVTEVNMTNTVASDTTTRDDQSKIEQVSQQTSEVIGSARDQATSVASTAREEVTGATQDAKEQAQRLVHESRRQLRRSADDQAMRLAQTLRD